MPRILFWKVKCIDPLLKFHLNLNNYTWYILSLTSMFQDKGIFTWMWGWVFVFKFRHHLSKGSTRCELHFGLKYFTFLLSVWPESTDSTARFHHILCALCSLLSACTPSAEYQGTCYKSSVSYFVKMWVWGKMATTHVHLHVQDELHVSVD